MPHSQTVERCKAYAFTATAILSRKVCMLSHPLFMRYKNSLLALTACCLVAACGNNTQPEAVTGLPGSTVDESGQASQTQISNQTSGATAPGQKTPPTEPSSSALPLDTGSSLTADISDLSGLVEELNGQVTDTEIIVELPADVLFDFDKAEISQDAVSTLEKLARLIQTAKSDRIQINGHTDSKGSDSYNMTLSERRAQSVQAWLVNESGLESSRFQTVGYGETQPVVKNEQPDGTDSPEGRAQNRRVEVILSRT